MHGGGYEIPLLSVAPRMRRHEVLDAVVGPSCREQEVVDVRGSPHAGPTVEAPSPPTTASGSAATRFTFACTPTACRRRARVRKNHTSDSSPPQPKLSHSST
jgi:hypothetical protein